MLIPLLCLNSCLDAKSWQIIKITGITSVNDEPMDKVMLCVVYTSISGEGDGTPLQYSCLENPMDRGAWWAAVHGVMKSRTWLSDFTFTFHFHALEKEMATHSSVLPWRIPGTGEPGGLLSMGLHRVRHDWSDLAAAAYIYISKSNVVVFLKGQECCGKRFILMLTNWIIKWNFA